MAVVEEGAAAAKAVEVVVESPAAGEGGETAATIRATAVAAKEQVAAVAAQAVVAKARQVRGRASGLGATAGQAVTPRSPG